MTQTESDAPALQCLGWEEGWDPNARQLPSPNQGVRPSMMQPDLIVIHSISLPPGVYGGPEVLQFFTNCLDFQSHPYFEQIAGLKVSAHFFIRRTGELWQFVDCAARAWHAGVSCYRGRSNCNDNSIGIELEGLEGDAFTSPQYATLAELCQRLMQRYPIAHLAGHQHIAPGRKGDPGDGFDWHRLQLALQLSDQYFPLASERLGPLLG